MRNASTDNLLFSIDGSRAVEVTRGGFEFSDLAPMFPDAGGKVTKPIALMVEGTYHMYDSARKTWRKEVITKEDIESYFANTPRDVPINYDHRQGGEAKGWVRLKDTGRIGTIQTPDGERTALYASMELFEQAASDVKRGYFRDVSIELRPINKTIIGNALTSYPVMRDTQFYSITADGDYELPDAEPAEGVLNPEEPAEEVVTSAETASNPEETQVNETAKQEAISEYLSTFGLTPAEMAELPTALAVIKQQENAARLDAAKARINELAVRDGEQVIAPGAIDAAAQLLAFCEENTSLNFSVNGTDVNPTGLLEQVFAGIKAVKLFGAITDEDGVTALTEAAPPAPADPTAPDEGRVSNLVRHMKQSLAHAA